MICVDCIDIARLWRKHEQGVMDLDLFGKKLNTIL